MLFQDKFHTVEARTLKHQSRRARLVAGFWDCHVRVSKKIRGPNLDPKIVRLSL